MLYTMKELLADAQARQYGVGYFNATDIHMIRSFIAAAEELYSPIIIGTSEGLLDMYGGFEWMAPALLSAGRKAKVPVAVHLDHAYRFDTIMQALRHGFGSVMFDGSRLSYDENKKRCREIARIAHAMDASAEFELGCVGGLENETGNIDENIYTDPKLAREFSEETHADFLAVAIGTVHGVYKTTPHLNLEILEELRSTLSIPLVLHGGSGLSAENFRDTIVRGICKINVYTDIVLTSTQTLLSADKEMAYADILLKAENAMKNAVMEKLLIFGSAGKA